MTVRGSRFTRQGQWVLPSAQGDVDKDGRWTREVQESLERRLGDLAREAASVPQMTEPSRDIKMLRWAAAGAKIFSTCGKRQYMAIILSPDGRVVGTGYNGSPPGTPHCLDGACPRLQAGSASGSSYDNCISIHAEANALMYSNRSERKDGTLVINGQPCWDCGKLIAGSGVARLVYIEDPGYVDAARVNTMISDTGIKLVPVPILW